jgi:hypothetical protein
LHLTEQTITGKHYQQMIWATGLYIATRYTIKILTAQLQTLNSR